MIEVLIADDEALVRGGFRAMLEAQPDIEVVGDAADGEEAVEQARSLRPAVVLMDIRMPRLDGLEATRRLLGDGVTRSRVLVLTTFDRDLYVYEALKAGASGFLLKDTPPERLAEAVRVVAGGEALLAPAITRRLIEEHLRGPTPGVTARSRRTGRAGALPSEALASGRGLGDRRSGPRRPGRDSGPAGRWHRGRSRGPRHRGSRC